MAIGVLRGVSRRLALAAFGVAMLAVANVEAQALDQATFATRAGDFLLTFQDRLVTSGTFGSLNPQRPVLEKDNITGITAQGLVAAYRRTGQPRFLNGVKLAANYLAARQGDFATADAWFLIEATQETGDPVYEQTAKVWLFDALESGTYARKGQTYNTAGYLRAIRDGRFGVWSNLYPWDVAWLLRAATWLGHPIEADLIQAVEDGLDDLSPGSEVPTSTAKYADTQALAHAVQALEETGRAGAYRCKGTNFAALAGKSLLQLADLLASKAIDSPGGPTDGAFPYFLTFQNKVTADESQSSAYAIASLSGFGSRYQAEVDSCARYLESLQQTSGEVYWYWNDPFSEDWARAEIASEAARGVLSFTRWTIGPAGGTIVCQNGATLIVPPGALSTATVLTMTPAFEAVMGGTTGTLYTAAGAAIELGPSGTTFASAVTVLVPYRPADIPAGQRPEDLVVARREASGAVAFLPVQSVDRVRHFLRVQTTQFSTFQAAVAPPGTGQAGAGGGSGGGGCALASPGQETLGLPLVLLLLMLGAGCLRVAAMVTREARARARG